MRYGTALLLTLGLAGCDSPRIPPENPTLEFEVRSNWSSIIAAAQRAGATGGRAGLSGLHPAQRDVAGYRPECGYNQAGRRVLLVEGVRFADPEIGTAEDRRRFDYLWRRAGC